MQIFMLMFFGIALVLVVGLLAMAFIAFWRSIGANARPRPRQVPTQLLDGMDEGDYHNGPLGYNAMSSYPDTSYYRGLADDDEHE